MHAMEEWRGIAGCEGCHQISSCGRVKSLERPIYRADGSLHRMQSEKILADRVNTYGYHLVLLSNMGATETKCIHRLVAEAFIPNDDGRPQVNHIDGNKANNGEEEIISTPSSRVKVAVIPTDEEWMIASDTLALVNA